MGVSRRAPRPRNFPLDREGKREGQSVGREVRTGGKNHSRGSAHFVGFTRPSRAATGHFDCVGTLAKACRSLVAGSLLGPVILASSPVGAGPVT